MNNLIDNQTVKVLGICIGMQIFFSSSQEAVNTKGLNLFEKRLVNFSKSTKKFNLPVPHVGFSEVKHPETQLWSNFNKKEFFYFDHSFMVPCFKNKNNYKLGHTFYGQNFVSYIEYKNIIGCQFHPEKSQSNGLKFLNNFLSL